MNDFYGLPTKSIANRFLRLEYLAQAGPRLVRMVLDGSQENLLAELPKFVIDTPYGDFYFHGGHRLWHSPEAMPRTYIPDNEGLVVEDLVGGVRLSQQVEAGTGIQKTLEVHLHEDRAALKVHHKLANQGLWPVELSVWAITQFTLGGVVILPQQQGPLDAAGLLPNRTFGLWPYTRWNDARLHLHEPAVLIDTSQEGNPLTQPCKIGYYNPHEWIAYWRKGVLFVKRARLVPGGQYPDGGCNSECYCNDKFVELESLSPLMRLEPGQAVEHTEEWELFTSLESAGISDDICQLLS
jgi:hypothetical protein